MTDTNAHHNTQAPQWKFPSQVTYLQHNIPNRSVPKSQTPSIFFPSNLIHPQFPIRRLILEAILYFFKLAQGQTPPVHHSPASSYSFSYIVPQHHPYSPPKRFARHY